MKKLIGILIILMILVSCGEDTWNKAITENSIEAYQSYIKKNPESKFIQIAKFKMDSLLNIKDSTDWINAKKSNSKEGYIKYLTGNTAGKYLKDADYQIKNIEDDEIWKEYLTKKSLDDINKFIEKYPENRNIELAKQLMNDSLKANFKKDNADIIEFISKISENNNFSKIKEYINDKIIYYDSIACFGVSGDDCDKCTKILISDSVSYSKVNIKSALLCLNKNYINGGLKREYYDYDGSIMDTEFFEYELTYISNGLKIKVYDSYGDFTFSFIRNDGKLYLTEIFAYQEMSDI